MPHQRVNGILRNQRRPKTGFSYPFRPTKIRGVMGHRSRLPNGPTGVGSDGYELGLKLIAKCRGQVAHKQVLHSQKLSQNLKKLTKKKVCRLA